MLDAALIKRLQASTTVQDGIFHFDSTESVETSTEDAEETGSLYDTPKTTLDDFELLKIIGKGSYGKVTLVRKKETGRLFAMKSLSKPNVKRRNQVEHTKTERRVLGRTKHPFIGMCCAVCVVEHPDFR